MPEQTLQHCEGPEPGRVPAERTTTYRIRKIFEQPDADERLPIKSTPRAMSMLGAGHAPITGVGY